MNTLLPVYKLTSVLALLLLAGCTGSSDSGNAGGGGSSGGGGGGGGASCTVPAGQPSTGINYTITWDAVSDADLSAYKIYYGTTSPLTKSNAQGFVTATSNMTSVTFTPATYTITTCTNVYLAVTAVGSTKPESALSTVQSITIE